MRKLFVILFFIIIESAISAGDPPKGNSNIDKPKVDQRFYFYWGYNRAAFAKSNIRFHSADYDFTLSKVRAKDRPTPVSTIYFKPTTISIPQYNYRIGYRLHDRWSVSIGVDHMKYVVTEDQLSHITGHIKEVSAASQKYAGTYKDDTIRLSPDFLHFEHTDGLNNLSIDGEFKILSKAFSGQKFAFHLIGGLGIGVVIPRTDIGLFGQRVNNKFHLAGYTANTKITERLTWKKRIFLESILRAGAMSLPDILVDGKDGHRASQKISYIQYALVLGFNF